jgi:putative hydrolase of the HAD superfamily
VLVRWIVFDYGEVISRRTRALSRLADMLGAPAAVVIPAYWALRERYDRGCTGLEYWQAVGERAGVDVDRRLAAALSEADAAGWLDTDPAALTLIAELDRAGAGLCLLSNAPSAHGEVFRRQPWARYFDQIMISGDLGGIAKPDPAIWAALTVLLDTPPGECLFLDDRQVNVAGARTAGLHAELWTGAADARAHLTRHRVLG